MNKNMVITGLCLLLLCSSAYAEVDPFAEDTEIQETKKESVKEENEEVETAKIKTENKEEVKSEEKKEETATSQYTVVSGDCLSSIAAKLLGSASRWPEIVEMNKDNTHR